MHRPVSDRILKSLICSNCINPLKIINNSINCANCGITYKYDENGSLDMRLKSPKKVVLEFEIDKFFVVDKEISFVPLNENTKKEVDFYGINAPCHLSNETLSYFPKAKTNSSLMLDLGCGGAIHKMVCERAGFEYVGLDNNSSKAIILGDGHALPFKADTFEFVLSIAVLEHIQYPFIMMKEVSRVLKKEGMFIGTVAFLEPFHGNSFYHHTHLGVLNCLNFGGFDIIKIAPSIDWNVLRAQANMSLFPKMPKWAAF